MKTKVTVRLGRVASSVPELAHALVAGALLSASYPYKQLFFSVVVFWAFTLWLKTHFRRRLVSEITEGFFRKMKEGGLVVVKEEDLNKRGLTAVSGEVKEADAG